MDLVAAQLQIAAGATFADLGPAFARLALTQPTCDGGANEPAVHWPVRPLPIPAAVAIQLRVVMEAPGAGAILDYAPCAGPGVRVESALYTGYELPFAYDPLLCKVRHRCLRRSHHVLQRLFPDPRCPGEAFADRRPCGLVCRGAYPRRARPPRAPSPRPRHQPCHACAHPRRARVCRPHLHHRAPAALGRPCAHRGRGHRAGAGAGPRRCGGAAPRRCHGPARPRRPHSSVGWPIRGQHRRRRPESPRGPRNRSPGQRHRRS